MSPNASWFKQFNVALEALAEARRLYDRKPNDEHEEAHSEATTRIFHVIDVASADDLDDLVWKLCDLCR